MLTPVTPAERRQAQDLADALDTGRPPRDAALLPLVELAGSLRPAAVGPSADFRLALRAELMREAGTTASVLPAQRDGRREGTPPRAPDRPSRVGRRDRPLRIRRRLVASAAVLTIIAGGAGTAAATQGALPGDLLYPVKRWIEDVETNFSGTAEHRGLTLLRAATARMDEAEELVDGQPLSPSDSARVHKVRTALTGLDAAASEGVRILNTVAADSGRPDLRDKVAAFSDATAARLLELAPLLPEDLQTDALEIAESLGGYQQQAATSCVGCGEGASTAAVSSSTPAGETLPSTVVNEPDESIRSFGRLVDVAVTPRRSLSAAPHGATASVDEQASQDNGSGVVDEGVGTVDEPVEDAIDSVVAAQPVAVSDLTDAEEDVTLTAPSDEAPAEATDEAAEDSDDAAEDTGEEIADDSVEDPADDTEDPADDTEDPADDTDDTDDTEDPADDTEDPADDTEDSEDPADDTDDSEDPADDTEDTEDPADDTDDTDDSEDPADDTDDTEDPADDTDDTEDPADDTDDTDDTADPADDTDDTEDPADDTEGVTVTDDAGGIPHLEAGWLAMDRLSEPVR